MRRSYGRHASCSWVTRGSHAISLVSEVRTSFARFGTRARRLRQPRGAGPGDDEPQRRRPLISASRSEQRLLQHQVSGSRDTEQDCLPRDRVKTAVRICKAEGSAIAAPSPTTTWRRRLDLRRHRLPGLPAARRRARCTIAVAETAQRYLSYANLLTYGFYVAGDSRSAVRVVDVGGATTHYVAYNDEKMGTSVEQSSLGWVGPPGGQNRGSMSSGSALLGSAAGTRLPGHLAVLLWRGHRHVSAG